MQCPAIRCDHCGCGISVEFTANGPRIEGMSVCYNPVVDQIWGGIELRKSPRPIAVDNPYFAEQHYCQACTPTASEKHFGASAIRTHSNNG